MRTTGDVYVAGTGAWLPRTTESVPDAVAAGRVGEEHSDLGYVSVAVEQGGKAAAEMAALAGGTAVRRAGIDRPDYGLVLHGALWYQGIEYWSAANFIANETVGAQAVAYSLDQRSCTGMGGLHLASAYIKAGAARAALVTTAERYIAPMDRFNSQTQAIYGDGGTAVALSDREGFARLLSTSSVADNRLEGYSRGTDGFNELPGAENPVRVHDRYEQYSAASPHAEQDWARWAAGLVAARDSALDDAGLKVEDIDHLVTPFVHRGGGRTEVHDAIGFREEQTLWHEFGRHVGHLGGGDQLAGLNYLVEQDRLAVGQHVLLYGLGMGFTFSAAILEIVAAPPRS